MSQSLIHAVFNGAKEVQTARKLVKLVAAYGFISLFLAVAIVFVPFGPLQEAISQELPDKLVLYISMVVTAICLVFLLKEKFWAPCILVALTFADMVLSYTETGDFIKSFGSLKFLVFCLGAQAVYFLNKSREATSEDQQQVSS